MAVKSNPYDAPVTNSVTVKSYQPIRIVTLVAVALAGIVMGSYISAELLYLHFNPSRSWENVAAHTFEAVIGSPLSMSVGVFPTMGFYRPHGLLVIPGFVMAIVGCYVYYQSNSRTALLIALAGWVLWAHNNYLGLSALMSV